MDDVLIECVEKSHNLEPTRRPLYTSTEDPIFVFFPKSVILNSNKSLTASSLKQSFSQGHESPETGTVGLFSFTGP